MKHPLQKFLDQIWNEGHTPQIIVDSTSASVVVPEHFRDRWKDALPIDLDANYPMHIEFSELGISADLASQGHVTRCFFPWGQIRAVVDRDTGKGILVRPPSDLVARLEGDQALWAGISASSCPYPEGSTGRTEWLEAWEKAKSEQEEGGGNPPQSLTIVESVPKSEISTPSTARGWVPKVIKGGKS